jgi:hypothetical protein
MGGIEAEDEPIEEAPAARRAVGEQAVHLRRQPDGADMVRQAGLASALFAVDLDHATGRGIRPVSGADFDHAAGGRDRCGHRPPPLARLSAARSAVAVHFLEPRAAQPAPRRKQRDRLQQVRLSGAVRAGQHDRPGVEVELGALIAAKAGQPKPANR